MDLYFHIRLLNKSALQVEWYWKTFKKSFEKPEIVRWISNVGVHDMLEWDLALWKVDLKWKTNKSIQPYLSFPWGLVNPEHELWKLSHDSSILVYRGLIFFHPLSTSKSENEVANVYDFHRNHDSKHNFQNNKHFISPPPSIGPVICSLAAARTSALGYLCSFRWFPFRVPTLLCSEKKSGGRWEADKKFLPETELI